MGQQFAGKVALVTGVGSGIGRASALAFAREGAKVLASDIDADKGEQTVAIIQEAGGEASFVRADVSQAQEVKALIKQTLETFGQLDYAHNNAGILGSMAPLTFCSEKSWDRVMSINLKGIWLCMKYEIPPMLKRGQGAIVNTASVAGLVGAAGLSAYAASKHGIIGLTKSAALDYAQAGLRINAVCPAVALTGMLEPMLNQYPEMKTELEMSHPMGRLCQPEEVAAAVIWLCSDAASFITGSSIPVDGGMIAR